MRNKLPMFFQITITSLGRFLILLPILEVLTVMRTKVAARLTAAKATPVRSVSRTMIMSRTIKSSMLLHNQENQKNQSFPDLMRMNKLMMNV